MKLIRQGLLLILILASGLVFTGYYWTFVRLAPVYEGKEKFAGISAEVTIRFDTNGVPEISAAGEADAFFALGLLHARERLWQMTVSQLTIDGRFSAAFGPDLLDTDRFLKTFDFAGIARQNLEMLSEGERILLQAYANGVNAQIAAFGVDLPVEFAITGLRPFQWEPYHSIGITRLMAWQLNETWSAEMAYAVLQQRLPAAEFNLIKPENWPDRYGKDPELQSSGTDSLLSAFIKSSRDTKSLLQSEGSHVGSNAWAVSGKKTASGKPLLAGDPHLGLAVPGVWYEASLKTPAWNVSGVTIPGLPGVVLGQKPEFAWSFTNVMADDADFFLEIEHPTDSLKYLQAINGPDTVWAAFDLTVHYIEVKNQAAIPFLVRKTQNGPVINSIYNGLKLARRPLICMNWTGFHRSAEFKTLLEINRAHDRSGFEAALVHFKSPAQNVVFADSSGFIARWASGKIPANQAGLPLFRPGWQPAYRWTSFLEFDQLPHDINPASGMVVSANNPIGTQETYISRYWEPSSRYNRLLQLLETRDSLRKSDFEEIAFDAYSVHARAFLNQVLPVVQKFPQRKSVQKTIGYLTNWDYRYLRNATAAGITDVFFLELSKSILLDDFGSDAYTLFTTLENIPVRSMDEILAQNQLFYDIKETPEVETRDSIIIQALDKAITRLEQEYGMEPYKWRWENLHTVTLKPVVLGEAAAEKNAPAALQVIVNNFLNIGPTPSPGHGMTINNGQYNWQTPFDQVLGASVRRVVDFSNKNVSWSIVPAGQSGNPFSKHYSDQHKRWVDGRLKPVYFSLPSSETASVLTLQPAKL